MPTSCRKVMTHGLRPLLMAQLRLGKFSDVIHGRGWVARLAFLHWDVDGLVRDGWSIALYRTFQFGNRCKKKAESGESGRG